MIQANPLRYVHQRLGHSWDETAWLLGKNSKGCKFVLSIDSHGSGHELPKRKLALHSMLNHLRIFSSTGILSNLTFTVKNVRPDSMVSGEPEDLSKRRPLWHTVGDFVK